MKLYIGTKQLKARPMTRGEYNDYRGLAISPDDDASDEGYLVEYLDGGKPNHPDHSGYISWSPKDVFERAYRSSETFLDRLMIELDELQEKHKKLQQFLESDDDGVGEDAIDMLKKQEAVMSEYVAILQSRISAA